MDREAHGWGNIVRSTHPIEIIAGWVTRNISDRSNSVGKPWILTILTQIAVRVVSGGEVVAAGRNRCRRWLTGDSRAGPAAVAATFAVFNLFTFTLISAIGITSQLRGHFEVQLRAVDFVPAQGIDYRVPLALNWRGAHVIAKATDRTVDRR